MFDSCLTCVTLCFVCCSTAGSGGSKSPGGTTPGTSGPDLKTPPASHKALHNVKGEHPSVSKPAYQNKNKIMHKQPINKRKNLLIKEYVQRQC